jgi:beta-glucanase (GH16 family)
MNLAIGGSWSGPPDGTTVFPATMQVDYVKVWQKA